MKMKVDFKAIVIVCELSDLFGREESESIEFRESDHDGMGHWNCIDIAKRILLY